MHSASVDDSKSGGFIGMGQSKNEITPLLGSDTGCVAGSSCLQRYDGSFSTLQHPSVHRRSSEKDSDDESVQNVPGSSIQKDKSPDRCLSIHTSASSTVDNDSEPCQSALDNLHRSKLRFALPDGISLRLENSGSVARDHLASERTFLSYMRTSLAIASSGVALVQLFSVAPAPTPQGSIHRLQVYIRPLGASTILVGLLVLFIGVTRYFTVQNALTKGYFPVARIATGFIAVMLTALVTLTFAIMLAGRLESRRS